jgi:hypothetical protein
VAQAAGKGECLTEENRCRSSVRHLDSERGEQTTFHAILKVRA